MWDVRIKDIPTYARTIRAVNVTEEHVCSRNKGSITDGYSVEAVTTRCIRWPVFVGRYVRPPAVHEPCDAIISYNSWACTCADCTMCRGRMFRGKLYRGSVSSQNVMWQKNLASMRQAQNMTQAQ